MARKYLFSTKLPRYSGRRTTSVLAWCMGGLVAVALAYAFALNNPNLPIWAAVAVPFVLSVSAMLWRRIPGPWVLAETALFASVLFVISWELRAQPASNLASTIIITLGAGLTLVTLGVLCNVAATRLLSRRATDA